MPVLDEQALRRARIVSAKCRKFSCMQGKSGREEASRLPNAADPWLQLRKSKTKKGISRYSP